MFRAEFDETKKSCQRSLPLAAGAAIFLGTAYLLFVAGLVFLVSMAFLNSPFRWFLAFLIVGVLWAIAGAIFASLARNQFRSRGRFPKTVELLKADGLWWGDDLEDSA
jgi:hypothetical protein